MGKGSTFRAIFPYRSMQEVPESNDASLQPSLCYSDSSRRSVAQVPQRGLAGDTCAAAVNATFTVFAATQTAAITPTITPLPKVALVSFHGRYVTALKKAMAGCSSNLAYRVSVGCSPWISAKWQSHSEDLQRSLCHGAEKRLHTC